MPSIATTETIIPKQLSAEARQQLTDDLYAVHCQIFAGVDKASFAKYVVESKAQQTVIHVYKNGSGAVVGYFALHVFEKELNGKPAVVFRAEAGTLRDYRGNNNSMRIGVNYALRYWLAHPNRAIFYLGTLVHPSSYMGLAKYAEVVWPNREQPVPLDLATFMRELADVFGVQPVNPQKPLVVHVGWRTIDTEVEHNYWRNCDKPLARFFVQENPSYSEGHGLMTLVPVSAGGLFRVAGRVLRDQGQRRVEPLWMTAQQLPLARQIFGVQDIQRRLQRTSLFADLPDEDLRATAQAAEVLTLPPGRFVFRAGDTGDELYVIASGAVYAVVEQNGEERIIDQLATGALFGEIALLSGEPRTASIRTANKSTLLQIKRKALLALMETHPRIDAAVWGAYARRRFADLTAGNSPHFANLSRQQRMDWFGRGQLAQLSAQQQLTVTDPWLFVITGAVEIQQHDTWSAVRAPALIQVTDTLQVVAQTPTQYVCLPAITASTQVDR